MLKIVEINNNKVEGVLDHKVLHSNQLMEEFLKYPNEKTVDSY
jgi:hypothetical protein